MLIAFLIGLGIIINGLVFTIPRKTVADRTAEAEAQKELDARVRNPALAQPVTNELDSTNFPAVRTSVTEHTTHHLNRDKS